MGTFNTYFLRNFQIHSRVLLTLVTIQFITSPWLIYLITRSLHLLTTFIPPRPLPLATTNLFSVSWAFFFQNPHTSEIIQYMSCSFWQTSLNIMPSRYSHSVANGRTSLFSYDWIILHLIYMKSVQKKSSHCQHNKNGLGDIDVTWQPRRVDWNVHVWTMMTSLY